MPPGCLPGQHCWGKKLMSSLQLDFRKIQNFYFICLISIVVSIICTGCRTESWMFEKVWETWLNGSQEVTIVADEKWQQIYSSSQIPRDWLRQSKLNLSADDNIWINGIKWKVDQPVQMASPLVLQVRRAQFVQLDDDGKISNFRSAEPTVISAIIKQGINLYEGDIIFPSGDTILDKPLQIRIHRSKLIKISSGTASIQTRSTASSVWQALLQADVSLQGWDEVSPSLDSPLPDNGLILVTSIYERLKLDYELNPYPVERKTLADVEAGKQQVIQEGAQGVQVVSHRIRWRGDEQVFQVQFPRWKVCDAQTRVVGIGSKLVPKTLEIPGGTITYWQAIPMYATSYSPCRMGKPGVCDYTTATGARLQKGVVAVTREDFALFGNAQVYIPGYGLATVADIGGGIPGKRWIDLGYGEEDYQPWSKEVIVYILASSQ